mmetsp:Transcript_7289/g.13286  ORF Transcript_7289/g.13286 Transcript_7289/m.13286 type:complete len:116 (-) Transcript_7289:648-995(-)
MMDLVWLFPYLSFVLRHILLSFALGIATTFIGGTALGLVHGSELTLLGRAFMLDTGLQLVAVFPALPKGLGQTAYSNTIAGITMHCINLGLNALLGDWRKGHHIYILALTRLEAT